VFALFVLVKTDSFLVVCAEYTLAKAVQDVVQMQTVLKEFRDVLQKFNQSAEGYILYGQV
jgi:hypothetical protein